MDVKVQSLDRVAGKLRSLILQPSLYHEGLSSSSDHTSLFCSDTFRLTLVHFQVKQFVEAIALSGLHLQLPTFPIYLPTYLPNLVLHLLLYLLANLLAFLSAD